jgi:serine/threonine protein phosphatase PrpC
MKNDESEKDKKNKGRFLSPSFRKGAVKEKKEEEDEGGFKINLIAAENDDDDESKSPSPPKAKKGKKKEDKEKVNIVPIKGDPKEKDKEKQKEHHHHRGSTHGISEDCKVNAIPEGRVKNVASYSQAGKGEDGFTKVNQDSFLVLQNQYNFKDFNIFAVMDGHGVNGHLVSRFVTKYFISFFKNNKKMNSSNSNEDAVCYRLKKNGYDIIKRLCRHAERDISKNSDIDANFSGTTCVLVFQIGEKIICGNVGDSRAILVKGNNEIIPLSIDQKPNDPGESERIMENGGEIAQFEEDGEKSGPFRVWKKGEVYPGIAMSRSIGDLIATTLGVIPEPKFIEEKIDNDTKFIVIASDGVWEFLENKAVVDIVMPFYKKNDPDGACKALIKESTEWWNKEDIVVDDITVVIVFF